MRKTTVLQGKLKRRFDNASGEVGGGKNADFLKSFSETIGNRYRSHVDRMTDAMVSINNFYEAGGEFSREDLVSLYGLTHTESKYVGERSDKIVNSDYVSQMIGELKEGLRYELGSLKAESSEVAPVENLENKVGASDSRSSRLMTRIGGKLNRAAGATMEVVKGAAYVAGGVVLGFILGRSSDNNYNPDQVALERLISEKKVVAVESSVPAEMPKVVYNEVKPAVVKGEAPKIVYNDVKPIVVEEKVEVVPIGEKVAVVSNVQRNYSPVAANLISKTDLPVPEIKVTNSVRDVNEVSGLEDVVADVNVALSVESKPGVLGRAVGSVVNAGEYVVDSGEKVLDFVDELLTIEDTKVYPGDTDCNCVDSNGYADYMWEKGEWQNQEGQKIQSALTKGGSVLGNLNNLCRNIVKPFAEKIGAASRTITSNVCTLLTKGRLAKEDTWEVGAKDANWFNDVFWRNTLGGANFQKTLSETAELVTLGNLNFTNERDQYTCDDGPLGWAIQGATVYYMIPHGGGGGGDDPVSGVTGGKSGGAGGVGGGKSGGAGGAP
ncbi:MAG: hypothetical protein KKF50_00595 [Nanoarchaeota archaeon]|nr:hypothetical protein [Nanoarchaeota archaeon]